MNQLIPIESVNAIELFSDEKTIQAMLDEIEKQAKDFEPDPTTPTGRKEIASQAHKVSRSKVVIDAAGKELTTEWAKKKKVVDAGRRLARDFCDDLRDEIRKPLTEYEAEEERRAQAAARKAELEACELEAYAENDLFDREAKVRETELKLAAEQCERDRIEAERKAEEDWLAVQEQIRKDATEAAKREAAEAIKRAAEEKEQAEARAKEQAEQAERDKTEAAERAEREKKEAIAQEQAHAKAAAEAKERERLRLIEDNEREAQRRAADKENRRAVNNEILTALVAGGVPEKVATTVIVLIASGNIPAMSIRY